MQSDYPAHCAIDMTMLYSLASRIRDVSRDISIVLRASVIASRLPFSLLFLFSACSSNESLRSVAIPELLVPEDLVGDVQLITVADSAATPIYLDVGINVFTVEDDQQQQAQIGDWIFEEIRTTEAQYMPFILRDVMSASNHWGAVRVLPEPDPSVDLLIKGSIAKSDGRLLQIRIEASDSSGRKWLERTYSDLSQDADYPDQVGFSTHGRRAADQETRADPFLDTYKQIANDLIDAKTAMSAASLENVKLVSQMRYAADLAPETFQQHLSTDAEGYWQVTSAAAANDPMLRRVEEMRSRHLVFIDTIDEYYGNLNKEMRPVYDMWRQYSREEIADQQRQRERESEPELLADYGSSGDFRALAQRYDRYKWRKIYEQEFTALAAGFNYELAPAVLELNQRVHGLTGSLQEQYVQWREILREIYRLENENDFVSGAAISN